MSDAYVLRSTKRLSTGALRRVFDVTVPSAAAVSIIPPIDCSEWGGMSIAIRNNGLCALLDVNSYISDSADMDAKVAGPGVGAVLSWLVKSSLDNIAADGFGQGCIYSLLGPFLGLFTQAVETPAAYQGGPLSGSFDPDGVTEVALDLSDEHTITPSTFALTDMTYGGEGGTLVAHDDGAGAIVDDNNSGITGTFDPLTGEVALADIPVPYLGGGLDDTFTTDPLETTQDFTIPIPAAAVAGLIDGSFNLRVGATLVAHDAAGVIVPDEGSGIGGTIDTATGEVALTGLTAETVYDWVDETNSVTHDDYDWAATGAADPNITETTLVVTLDLLPRVRV